MLCPICATVLFNFFKVMSHLSHRRFYKIPPRGPIFMDGSIVTKVCYSISPLGKQNLY